MSGDGYRVSILDQSAAEADRVVEQVGPFATVDQANEFARAYVRDSIERCRAPGFGPHEVLAAWFAYGEDAVVADAPDEAWESAGELAAFADDPATEAERDWRALDPRRP